MIAKVKKWQQDNPEKKAAQNKKYAQANPDKKLKNTRKWQQNNPDKVAEGQKRYRQNNQDKKAASAKKWRQANPDKEAVLRHKRRTRKTKAGGSFTSAEFKQLCNQYDNYCLKCGESKPLTADHVVPVALGGTSDISNIQPLCKSCNSSKGATIKDYRNRPLLERWRTISIFDLLGL
jgi:5-methylcytosine-specific restriction endonuclease McrA